MTADRPRSTNASFLGLRASKVSVFTTAFPLKWMSNRIHLNYFLKQLYEQDKIYDGEYFKLAEYLIIDKEGKPFKGLKNNRGTPKEALLLDKIISLY